MVLTESVNLPSHEELTVPEVQVSASVLRAASFHLGKYCENVNNEFMLCRSEYRGDPRKCLDEGKVVTSCTLEFFKKLKSSCRDEFETYAECVDKSSSDFKFSPCRKTQSVYDKCVLDKMDLERPPFGYFCEIKIHDSPRPKPPVDRLPAYPDAVPALPEDYPKTKAKYSGRNIFQ